jgi:hypothetical protein
LLTTWNASLDWTLLSGTHVHHSGSLWPYSKKPRGCVLISSPNRR